ncbi:SusC/RagA family TonB-linked outer membrane protein [Flavobacterium palustre]|uniref:SusC/RagA family TonB-linked outer membrane protein n=1 Tax=Flavobacterium palustre TaxID=1476463 RepID=A0ABQ1HAD5_9FLAO|nr:TonB-dependent receptor [Flavobacterium palustre]GGA66519.1 SusC/RagA family TonB-linked outer membrane protein [Flavobacterium palustre]
MKKVPDCAFGFDLRKKLTLFCVLASLSQAQAYTINYASEKGLLKVQQQKSISGQINDENGMPLPGATVSIRDTKIGTITDFDGKFTLKIDANSKVLVVSSIGYQTIELQIGNRTDFKVQLKPSSEGLEEVVVVGFGTQKKESVVSAITTIPVGEIKGPSSNLTTMMAGRVSGMIAYQRSGEPGSDNSDFFIRGLGSFGSGKVNPLILIDGIESTATDMARVQPDDIESFSVLKDASAASIYGARGANGVVLITTKSGKDGKLKVKFRQENKISGNTKNFKFADNITYMQLANEAVLTRNPIGVLPYSQTKIDRTAAGADPILYPNNNWIDQLIKDYTFNQGYNLSVSGGSDKAQYYVASTYNIDNGVLKVDNLNNFNSNIKLRNYSFRSNVNMKLTPSTEAIVRLYGQFDDYTGPLGGNDANGNWVSGGGNIFNKAVWSNPVAFPATYPNELLPYIEHPLFGGAVTGNGSTTLLTNPYAEMVKGYEVYKASTIQTQIELKQDLKAFTPGLRARAMGYVRRYSYYRVSRQYNPFFYSAMVNPDTEEISLTLLNSGTEGSIGTPGTEYLNYSEGAKNLTSTLYLETAVNYNRVFAEKHDVSGMLINIMQTNESGNAGNLQSSLPSRNFGLSGRFTYAYDSRYLAEINFGYNGSERFAQNNRFGFFPSFAVGYSISNEKFFEPLLDVVSSLKFRASYGWVGNDQIGNSADRFFYLSNVNLNDANYGASFGDLNGYYRPGVSISRYANEKISWERSKQINIGMDLKLFNSINIVVDAFKQTRSNILQTRSNIGSTLGLAVTPSTNFGQAESQGMDMSINYNEHFGDNWFVNFRGNLTYSTSKILKYDENYYPPELDYLYRKGNSIAQSYGYIAERLFVDDQEAANSPRQFGTYGGGDIKYRDVNGDGVITSLDQVPIGYPTSPEIIYGFGGTLGYKDFDFSLFFQGSARSSFFINPRNISPFVTNGGAQNGLLKVVADDHWSEDNRDVYAFWPRLSNNFIDNNNQSSTWWMRNGAFLRLKSVELGYNLPDKIVDKFHISGLRVYANTTNPVVFSQFKLWDPEMGGNGLGYPVQSTYNFGILLDL